MELPILYRPIQNKILIGILCVVGTIILTVSTSRYGIGVSVDSVGYMADARILTARFDPSLFAENIFVLQPPLYPIILATVSTIFQCDPLSAARFVSVAAFALTLYCAGVLLHRAFPDFQFLAVLGTTAVLFSHPLFQISNMAWTEPIFIFLTVLFLLSCGIFYETHKAIWFGIMVMCAIVAPFVRYIGVVFAPSGALVLLLVFHKSLRIKIKYAIFLAVVATLPIGLWLARNIAVSGTALGQHVTSYYTLSQNIILAFRTVGLWLIPQITPGYLLIVIPIILLATIVIWRNARTVWVNRDSLYAYGLPSLVLATLYILWLIIAATMTALDEIGFRLMSPVFVPVIILFLFASLTLSESLTRYLPQALVRIALLLILAVSLVYIPATNVIAEAKSQAVRGAGGFNRIEWRESQTIRYLNMHGYGKGLAFYSNQPWALRFLADLPARQSPARTAYHSTEILATISDLQGVWPPSEPAFLVWFNHDDSDYLFSLADLQSISKMTLVADLADGAIYLVARK